MFKKLLKYDMKSIANVWWILAVSVLGASVLASFLLRFCMENDGNGAFAIFMVLAMLMLFVCLLGIIMSVVVTEILVYLRFYKNFYTDEGYLTFTLPVSRKMLLLSKTLNALIWTGAHLLLYVVCALIFMLIVPPAEAGGGFFNPVAFEWLGQTLSEAWNTIGAWLIVYMVEVLLLFTLALTFSINLIHYCITMGAVIAKKMKLLAAIGIYYLVNMILSFVMQFAALFGTLALEVGFSGMLANASQNLQSAAVAVVLLLVCAIVAAISCTLYFMTLGKLERKLNLA